MLRWSIRIALAAALISALRFAIPLLRSPESQAKRQHEELLSLAAHRNWARVYPLLAADYRDAWDQTRDEALNAAREGLSSFLALSLHWTEESVARDGKTVTLTGTLRMSGSGPAGSSLITDHVNKIAKPWTFVWRKTGWKASDWSLVSVANPDAGPY
jgi:hypothetical protein